MPGAIGLLKESLGVWFIASWGGIGVYPVC